MKIDFSYLSRMISHALRHEPWLYELELDEEGWVPMESLLVSLRASDPQFQNLEEKDLEKMISVSQKKRHEIKGKKIRALYGHSIPGKLIKSSAVPPEVLYHGTNPNNIDSIRSSGLLPMNRQYVHFSETELLALEVGRRKSPNPIVLKIFARNAKENGVVFYHGNEHVWLADQVPSEFIDFGP